MVHETVERSESKTGIIHTFNEKDVVLWTVMNGCGILLYNTGGARDCHELQFIFFINR